VLTQKCRRPCAQNPHPNPLPKGEGTLGQRRILAVGGQYYVEGVNHRDEGRRMDSDTRVQREQLLRRAVLAGDEAAWRTWYDETFDALRAYVVWRCGGRHDRADEVVQETWLTAVRRIRGFDPSRGSFGAWLCGLAANVLRHQLRQRDRRRKRERDAAQGNGAALQPTDHERDDQIALTLDALPERQEAVLRAKYLDGLTVAEIAAQWDDTPKAIESLLSRAREAFRELYEKPR
jgi:RNA polymerase sigma-70 factor, ECF subfamily